jgi:DNA-binding MurR/RpiR family transcriptional regulator
VSPPTALRLVTKLGFTGYPDFQRNLREEVQARVSSPSSRYPLHDPSPGGPDVVASAFQTLIRNLQATAAAQSESEFKAVARLLADRSRRILALGGRVSHVLAIHLIGQLRMLRPNTHLLPAGSARLMDELVDLTKRDVVVVFDYRRYQQDTVEFGHRAARHGATIVAITDPWLSPVAQAARHVLTFDLESLPPLDSPIGGFALVEALLAEVASQLGASGRSRLAEIERLNGSWMWDSRLIANERLHRQ